VLGRWASDLEAGDVLPTVEYVVTPFLVREYCHGVEELSERFHAGDGTAVAPPTFVHTDKIRVLDLACPEPGGPQRLHYEFDADLIRPVPVGTRVVVTGEVVDRVKVRGRERLLMTFEVRDAATGDLFARYRDTTLLSYLAEDDS
jgi:hypothetical protein